MKSCFRGLQTLVLLFVLYSGSIACAITGPLWIYNPGGDVPVTLAVLPDITGDSTAELLVGYDSGNLICLDPTGTPSPTEIWTAAFSGSILALLPVEDSNDDGSAEVIVATDLGQVARIEANGPTAGETLWSFYSTCNVQSLTLMDDIDSDSVHEIAASGANHRTHLLNGKTGSEIWSRFLDDGKGTGYITRTFNAGDLDGDLISDLIVRTWYGMRWAISGSDGTDIWGDKSGSSLTSVLASTGDLNGDTYTDFIEGGNSGILYLRSGSTDSIIWSCALGRPLREALVTEDVTGDGIVDCFATTAGGRVACISGAGSGGVAAVWTAEVGDVGRDLVSPSDIDGDDKPDVVVASENGTVTAFSGSTGTQIWQWQGEDVVRNLVNLGDVNGDGYSDVAAGLLNGKLVLLSGESNDSTPATKMTLNNSDRRSQSPIKPTQDVNEVAILLYHDVLPEAFFPCCSAFASNFEAQMDVLVEGGFTTVSLDQVADWIEGTGTLPERPVCITFDGPYDGHHTHAYKILQDRGLFATSYITTDWIGTENHLDWHQLRELEDTGVMEIQNHSINHPSFTSISSNAVIEQVTGCYNAIYKHLNGKISRHHAYPGGAYNSTIMQTLRDIGVRTATTVEARKTTRSDDLLALPRYSVVLTTSIASFKSMVGYQEPTLDPLPYEFVGTVGSGWSYMGYGDVDAEGKLWICDYGNGEVRIFNPDGSEADFSPITHGLVQDGTSTRIEAPSGVTITPSGEAIVTIADYEGTTLYFGLFRYRTSDGQVLQGYDLPYRPGDIDCDANGLLYVVNKVVDEWHVYSPDFDEIPGSPFGSGSTDYYVQRGISVLPDSSKVYTISETSLDVRVWEGSATITSANYTQADDLVENLSGRSGGVDVMDDGTIFVGYNDEGYVRAFDAEHKPIGDISGGTPTLAAPRGVAFTPDGSVLWIISSNGFVQRWERISSSVPFWIIY